MKAPRRRHVPMRTCVACGLKTEKRELLRVVSSPDGSVTVDDSGRRNGRGAYLCVACRRSPDTLSRGRLEYSLRTRIDEDAWGTLLQAVVAESSGTTVP
jgi:predicted RNA-binding protein YlxR (DUF448 family)